MNRRQATRGIRTGSWWNDGEKEMRITEANSRSVYGTTPEGASCWYELWYFREKLAPGRLANPASRKASKDAKGGAC